MNQESKKIPTGLFFGSFNPVHTGHLIIADYFLQNTGLQQIWFVLSPQNPLKTDKDMLGERERIELLKVAISDNPAFYLCDIELGMERPSYTVKTLSELKTRFPEREFVLIIGSDNLEEFERWKEYKKLLEETHIYVYKRSEKLKSPFASHPNVKMFESPLLNVSSSMIRDIIAEGREPRYLVPGGVLKLIGEKGFYSKQV